MKLVTYSSDRSSKYPVGLHDSKVVEVFVDMLEIRAKVSQKWGISLKRSDQVISVTACKDSYYVHGKLAEGRSVPTSMRGSEEYNSIGASPYRHKSTIEIRRQQSLQGKPEK